MSIPELESLGCEPPAYVISNNTLRFVITFPDGEDTRSLTLESGFPDITVVPVYHCGDEVCESNLGENASNCCYDCPCSEAPEYGDDYYCEYDEETFEGSCQPKNAIRLVVDSPTAPVVFDSCEIDNEVNVKMHIKNAPSTFEFEHEYAVINNTNAEFFYCDPETTLFGNTTYNCTLLVPSITECSRGKTYVFEPNDS